MKKLKTVFTFNVANVIEIITNSSSELFVLEGETKDIVAEMIKSVYPGYLTEYEDVKCMNELTTEELDTYVSYAERDWDYHRTKEYSSIRNIEPNDLYKDWGNRNDEKFWYPELSDSGAEKLKKAIDPNDNMWFLFSIDENPNWDAQEDLMDIGIRYHLG